MCYVPVHWCLWPTPLSPLQYSPALSSMSTTTFPGCASLSPPLASALSICRLFDVPPSSAGCHPPSSRMTDWRPVPCWPWCPVQRPDVWEYAPPTCSAGGTWLGCGWRGVGDSAPPMILRSSMGFHHTTRRRQLPGQKYLSRSWFPSMIWLPVSVCPPPPLPFPRTTVRVPIPSLLTGQYFRGRPARPHPAGLPCPQTPVGLLNANRAPFRVLPPLPITWPFLCLHRYYW